MGQGRELPADLAPPLRVPAAGSLRAALAGILRGGAIAPASADPAFGPAGLRASEAMGARERASSRRRTGRIPPRSRQHRRARLPSFSTRLGPPRKRTTGRLAEAARVQLC